MDLSLRPQQLFRLTAEQKSSALCHFGGAYSLECAVRVRGAGVRGEGAGAGESRNAGTKMELCSRDLSHQIQSSESKAV